jgi:RNA polymerase sigma-70 factor, ECF subfamily
MRLSTMSDGMTKAAELRLIRLASRGDLDAATTLIKAHQGSVTAYIRRLCGKEDLAEDVVQEAFARVLLNLDRFDPTYRFSTWLFTIARRLMLNITAKMHPMYDSERVDAATSSRAETESLAERAEVNGKTKDLLERALMSLPPDQREVVVLFHQHDWPISLIADQLDLPEGTVKSHLFRGRIRLREEYLKLETALEAELRTRHEAARRETMRSVRVNELSSILVAVREEPKHPLHAESPPPAEARR